MDVLTLKKQIQANNLDNFYIFTGVEVKVQDVYIAKIAEISELDVFRADTVASIVNNLRNVSFLAKNHVYVIRDDKDFISNDKAWDSIQDMIGDNKLILLISSLDKRSKFYKQYKDMVIEFTLLNEAILTKYIKKEIDINNQTCKKLCQICENDLSRIYLEIDKIIHYADAKHISDEESFKKLLSDGIIYQPPQDAIFELVSSIMKYDIKLSYQLAEEYKKLGQSSLALISVLFNTLKQTLQVQCCQSSDVSSSTGLSSWQIKCVQPYVHVYNASDLIDMMYIVQETEQAIKIGQLEEASVIDYLLVNLF